LEGENGAGVLAAKLARGMRHAALLRTPCPAWGTNRCNIGEPSRGLTHVKRAYIRRACVVPVFTDAPNPS
jgi:hypothetical protein